MSPERRAIVEKNGWMQIQHGVRAGMWRYSDTRGSILLADGSEPDEEICCQYGVPPEVPRPRGHIDIKHCLHDLP